MNGPGSILVIINKDKSVIGLDNWFSKASELIIIPQICHLTVVMVEPVELLESIHIVLEKDVYFEEIGGFLCCNVCWTDEVCHRFGINLHTGYRGGCATYYNLILL